MRKSIDRRYRYATAGPARLTPARLGSSTAELHAFICMIIDVSVSAANICRLGDRGREDDTCPCFSRA